LWARRRLSVLPQEADQVPSEDSPRRRGFHVGHYCYCTAKIIHVAEFDARHTAGNLGNVAIGDRCSGLSQHARHYIRSARTIAAVLIAVAGDLGPSNLGQVFWAKYLKQSILGATDMSTSRSQIERLSPEERIVYKRWLRGGLLFYGTLTALFIITAVANQFYTNKPDKVAYSTTHAAEISARN
jgi:hypothetical protein